MYKIKVVENYSRNAQLGKGFDFPWDSKTESSFAGQFGPVFARQLNWDDAETKGS